MAVKISLTLAGYAIITLVSSIAIGYTLLQYEPNNPDVAQFVVAILLFLSFLFILSSDITTLGSSGVGDLAIAKGIAAILLLAVLFVFTGIKGYEAYAK